MVGVVGSNPIVPTRIRGNSRGFWGTSVVLFCLAARYSFNFVATPLPSETSFQVASWIAVKAT